jgi:hypothetical protein
LYYCPNFPLRERPGEKNIFRNNEVCALIPRGFKMLTGFLFSHSHNGTFCNDLTPQHGTTTELENIYRLDLSDGYVDENKGRVYLKEERINTARHIHKL